MSIRDEMIDLVREQLGRVDERDEEVVDVLRRRRWGNPSLSGASDEDLVAELISRGFASFDSSTVVPVWLDDGPCPDDCQQHPFVGAAGRERHHRLAWRPARCFQGWLPRQDGS